MKPLLLMMMLSGVAAAQVDVVPAVSMILAPGIKLPPATYRVTAPTPKKQLDGVTGELLGSTGIKCSAYEHFVWRADQDASLVVNLVTQYMDIAGYSYQEADTDGYHSILVFGKGSSMYLGVFRFDASNTTLSVCKKK